MFTLIPPLFACRALLSRLDMRLRLFDIEYTWDTRLPIFYGSLVASGKLNYSGRYSYYSSQ
jgi:hypothetical protein